jgi:hypothetical protein
MLYTSLASPASSSASWCLSLTLSNIQVTKGQQMRLPVHSCHEPKVHSTDHARSAKFIDLSPLFDQVHRSITLVQHTSSYKLHDITADITEIIDIINITTLPLISVMSPHVPEYQQPSLLISLIS